jgi:hypothetical protein
LSTGAGISIAAINYYGLGKAIFQMPFADINRRGPYIINGKNTGSRTPDRRIDNGNIFFTLLFNICTNTLGHKPHWSRNPSINYPHYHYPHNLLS